MLIKLLGIFITIIARIFALVAPNLIGNSITIIENYLFSNLYELEIVKEKLIINILMIHKSSSRIEFTFNIILILDKS